MTTAINRPEFRADLVSRPIEQNGQLYVDVTDPDTGNTFRFYEVEYAVACAMDGNRDMGGLVQWSREELGVEPSADELELIVNTLEDLGYLKGVPAKFIAGETPAGDWAPPPSVARREADTAPPPTRDAEFQLGLPGRSEITPMAAARAAAANVELGVAGKSAFDEVTQIAPSARADVELGLAGGGSAPPPAAREVDETDFSDLAPPGSAVAARAAEEAKPARRSVTASASDDVSVDLSQHLAIGTEDVREAVRHSKVMQAVSPVGFDEESDSEHEVTSVDSPPQPPPSAPDYRASERAAAEEAQRASKRAADDAARQPQASAPRAPQAAAPAPVPAAAKEAPRAQPAVKQTAEPAPTEKPSRSGALIGVLVVLVLAAAAFWYWWSFLRPSDDASSTPAPETGAATAADTETAAQPAAATAPTAAPPAAEAKPAAAATALSATIKASEPAAKELTSPRDGAVGWVASAGTDVAADAPVVKFAGFAAAEKKLAEAEQSQARYQAKYDKAAADGDKAQMADAEANVKRKQLDIDKAKAELAKLVVGAPAAGTVEPIAKLNEQVKSGQPLVRIAQAVGPQATFELPDGAAKHDVGAKVKLRDKSDADLPAVECEVTKLEGAAMTVTCPSDTNLTDGTAVVLE